MLKSFRAQTSSILSLAVPITLTQMGQMAMGLVDLFMVGKLGPQSIGAVALAGSLFTVIYVFGAGLLSSLDYFVSKSNGENNHADLRIWKTHGLYFSIFISIPLTILVLFLSARLTVFGIPPETAALSHEFLKIYVWSLIPMMIYFSQRLYLQAIGTPQSATAIIIAANILNFSLNWLLISGHWGFPALGITGSAISTLVTRLLMAAIVIYIPFGGDTVWLEKIRWNYIKQLLKLGLPAGLQNMFEVSIYAVSTALVSRLSTDSLAAHTIVLNIVSFTFTIPSGVSEAAAIRVGYFVGEKNLEKAKQAGDTTLFLSAILMCVSGFVLFFAGQPIIKIFTSQLDVVYMAGKIILLGALFQVADGVQVVATGAMRGLGNTKISAVVNVLGYWLLAFPISYYLCFVKQWGLIGVWTGLSIGLITVMFALLFMWNKLNSSILKTI